MNSRFERLGLSLRAIGPTLSANLLNQAVVALSQLIAIPLLVSCWGVAGFGTWVLLTAIPNYLTISDLGFTTSAKSDMAVRAVRGDIAGARVTSSSVAAMLAAVLSVLAVVYLGIASALDWTSVFTLSGVANSDAQAVLCLGFLQLASYQAFLLSAAVIRATGRPATEALLSAGFRAIETSALVVTALRGGDVVAAAFAWAMTRSVTTALLWLVLYRRVPTLVPRIAAIEWSRIRRLLRPSLAYMLVPLASAMMIQGTIVVLGLVSTPVVIAAYSTLRVATRLGVSAANALNFAFTPQYSYAMGSGAMQRFESLLKTHYELMVAGNIAYVATMLVAGRWLVGLLSHGQVDAPLLPLALLTAAAAFEMLWSIALSIGSATNTVGRLSTAFLALSVLSLAITSYLSWNFAVTGAAAAVALTHFLMLIVALISWRYHHGDAADRVS